MYTHPVPLLLLTLAALTLVLASPALVPFSDCFSGNVSQKLNVSSVYVQMFPGDEHGSGRHLNFTVFGNSAERIIGSASSSNNLATLFTMTETLTLDVWDNSSYFCQTLRPPEPLPAPDNSSSHLYCPIAAGPFAFSSYVPLDSDHELESLQTRLRAVDPFSDELLCIDLFTTNLSPGTWNSVYGHTVAIFWGTLALALAYWLVVLVARIIGASSRGTTRTGPGVWGRVESTGFLFASALSGERFAALPALMRYCTPSMRDILFHTQWVAALSMVAVQWPSFIYPIAAQARWSTLSWNITLTQGQAHDSRHWDPTSVAPYNPPSNFIDQLNDPSTPLYINASTPNTLFMLPPNTKDGIQSFAYAVGLHPQDLFGTCLGLFLILIAAAAALSAFIKLVVTVPSLLTGIHSTGRVGARARSPGPYGPRVPSAASKDMLAESTGHEEDKSHQSHFLFSRGATAGAAKSPFKFRPNLNSFHLSILHGNLVRILVWFHFPITIFSCYQMTLGRTHASTTSIAFAALSFMFFSVIIPFLLVLRLVLTSTNKLYDETRTLLALGPLYNHYRQGSQLFACVYFINSLVMGITVGCGQKSGTAQAIIILIVEVVSALATSVWLPWGQGASMGLISFLFCIGRIVIAVLLIILTPTVSIGQAAGGWIAYAILLILGLIYLAFFLLLLVKIIEAIVRLCGGIGFDRSKHVVDSGLIGACGLLGCCGGGRQTHRRRTYRNSKARRPSEQAFVLPSQLRSQHTTNSGPPSVLRPEEAMRPYKEADDEDPGFIMGAWQPFPRSGYAALEEQSASSSLGKASGSGAASGSGFARVAGGRAHYENPYHIQARSDLAFPSQSSVAGTHGRMISEEDVPPTASVASFARHAAPVQHPSALGSHQRTRSQTAIVEDVALLRNVLAASPHEASEAMPLASASGVGQAKDDDDDDESVQLTPKHRNWFSLGKKGRRQSAPVESMLELAVEPPLAEPGRSFVVVRKQGPRQQSSSMEAAKEPSRSFDVLR